MIMVKINNYSRLQIQKHAKKKWKKLLKKNWFNVKEYTYEDYKRDKILEEDPDYFNEQEYPS